MKVKNVIAMLQNFDPELEVVTYVPEYGLDPIIAAGVIKIRDAGDDSPMFGKYEEILDGIPMWQPGDPEDDRPWRGIPGEPFDALLLAAG